MIPYPWSQHHNAHASSPLLIGKILLVDSARNGRRSVIVQVEMELTVTGAELELFEKQRVIGEGEGVEDIKTGLGSALDLRPYIDCSSTQHANAVVPFWPE